MKILSRGPREIAVLLTGLVSITLCAHPATAQKQVNKKNKGATATLTLDQSAVGLSAMKTTGLAYRPNAVPLTEERPRSVTKEPAYQGTAHYGVVTIGNGPESMTVVVIDDRPGGGGKLYVDSNHNGDLTDDGDGAWAGEGKNDSNLAHYNVTPRLLRASWGTRTKETSTGAYTVGFYYTEGQTNLMFFRQAARVGTIAIGGKPRKVMLIENNSNAMYGNAPQQWLWITPGATDTDALPIPYNKKGNALVAVNAPFRLEGKAYEATPSVDGSRLVIAPTTKPVPVAAKPAPRPSLLAVGTAAPDFACVTPDGKTVKLSDFKGKTVVLDFWATWCGPCKQSMPHLENIYKQVQSRDDVTVLALCVWDSRAAFDGWVKNNIGTTYTFPVAFDPAANDNKKSIASSKFNVSGIPTQYVIDKDGRVAAAFIGFEGAKDTRLEAALGKQGITLAPTQNSVGE